MSFPARLFVPAKFITPIAQRLRLLLTVAIIVAPTTTGVAEDQMVLGPRQFEGDRSGAVLCIWLIYATIQAATAACGLPRQPSDEAIDKAITDMDEFILANSSLHPTRAMLDNFKRRRTELEMSVLRRKALQKFCDGPDIKHFRNLSPDYIQAEIKRLLAVPREPVMNPCL